MTIVELGRYGAVLAPTEGPELAERAAHLEELGFATIWLTGGAITRLDQVTEVVQATERVTVATGILAVVRWPSDEVARLYADLEDRHPGRLVVGLGGAHGPEPIPTLERYLDALDAVPRSRRLLAALGPRMFRLARERTGGAFPVLVTPERTAEARQLLGPEPTLAVDQLVVLDDDEQRGRRTGRQRLEFLASMPAYQANFRRMGFTDDDIASLSPRLVDALVPWGSAAAIAAHVQAQQAAGADHVALTLVSSTDQPSPAEWRTLADAVLRG